MRNALFSCTNCESTFRNRFLLNYHVKRYHQSSVKVKYYDGHVREVKKGVDGTFKCRCEKSFKAPTSLRKHAKTCREERDVSENIHMENVNMMEEVSDASGMEESEETQVSDTPVDCFGALIYREKC